MRRFLLGVLIAFVTLTGLQMAGLVTVDHFAGTYGYSVGTSTRYCSAEDKLPVLTCEHAR